MENLMTKDPKLDLPPIPDLTVNQAHRTICADYLRSVANMIERGQLTGFEFVWNTEIQKPIGKVLLTAETLVGPAESKILHAIADYRAEQERKIPVTDISDQLKEQGIDPIDPDHDN
jgi:hypothetical protein